VRDDLRDRLDNLRIGPTTYAVDVATGLAMGLAVLERDRWVVTTDIDVHVTEPVTDGPLRAFDFDRSYLEVPIGTPLVHGSDDDPLTGPVGSVLGLRVHEDASVEVDIDDWLRNPWGIRPTAPPRSSRCG
jgi:hypothetical protein